MDRHVLSVYGEADLIPDRNVIRWWGLLGRAEVAATTQEHCHPGRCVGNQQCVVYAAGLDCSRECPAETCGNTLFANGVRQVDVEERTIEGQVRTRVKVTAGAEIVQYVGILVEVQAYKQLAMVVQQEGTGFLSAVDYGDGSEFALAARETGNWARLVRHSCDPNLKSVMRMSVGEVPQIRLVAVRDIEPGEVLTLDFERQNCNAGMKFDCACRRHTTEGEQGDKHGQELHELLVAGEPAVTADEKEEGECSDDEEEQAQGAVCAAEQRLVTPSQETDAEDGVCSDTDDEVAEGVARSETVTDKVFNSTRPGIDVSIHEEKGMGRRQSVIRFAAEGRSECASEETDEVILVEDQIGEQESQLLGSLEVGASVERPAESPATSESSSGSSTEKRKLTVRLVDIGKHAGAGRRWVCRSCDRTFGTPELLRLHKAAHIESKPRRRQEKTTIQCNICGQVCGKRESLEYHMRLHSSERPLGCGLCTFRFDRRDTLKRHICSMHKEIGEAEIERLLDESSKKGE